MHFSAIVEHAAVLWACSLLYMQFIKKEEEFTLLQFILGTAGTGKTTRLLEELAQTVGAGGKAILLVPEQYSFEAERMLIRTLGQRLSLEVEVLSFTRLAGSIFRRFGGLAGVNLSQAGKYLLMSVALAEIQDSLQIYRKSTVNTAFLTTMVETCGEMKTAGISPEKLADIGALCEPSPLKDKLEEIALVYQAYQSLLDKGYTDPEDDLARASALLRQGWNYFGGTSVFVDGFTTFMAAEFQLLELAMAQGAKLTFAMTTDRIHDAHKGIGVFSPVKKALTRLMRMANKTGIKTAPPEILQQPVRYKHPALAVLSQNLFTPSPGCYEGDVKDSVRLFAAGDTYREWEYVASSIAALVREEGYRYNQIAVVARDMGRYLRVAQIMLDRYHIPYFTDNREEVESLPLISGVLAALDAVRSNFDPQVVLQYAKSPIAGQDLEQIALLENYCYCWGVRGAVWQNDFMNNPQGLAEALTQQDISTLEVINSTRQSIMAPLLALKNAIKGGTGKSFATGIFEFLQAVQAANTLTTYAHQMEQGERESFLDLSTQLWDILMEILDVFGAVLGGVGLTTKRACELFRLAVNAAEVAQVPQTLDQVLLGQADRIRPGEIRAVFVVGVNEGVFPPAVVTGGLFTDAERQAMIALGAEIAAPALEKSVLEKYFGYFALTLPTQRLYITYANSDLSGGELLPSVLVSAVQELLPSLKPDKLEPMDFIGGDKSAFLLLSSGWRQDTPLIASLRQQYQQGEKAEALSRMQRAAISPPHRITHRETAKALFGGRMRLSPSKVERYYSCPFSYFAANGLELKKRRRVEFTPLESGSVIHNVLQVMVQRRGGKGLARLEQSVMEAQIREIIGEYLSSRIEDMQALPVRFQYLFGRLTGMLVRLLTRLGKEFAQSDFEVAAVELPISHRDGISPLELVTADNVAVSVEGVVDRVDVMEKNGKRYVRVVDYKSGSKEFKLHDVLYGLNLQMLLYLFTIGENGTGALANAIPAGVLYMPVRESFVTAGRNTDEQTISKDKEKQWKMNGLLLEDPEVLQGMEQDLAGVFIPAKLKKDGTLDAKSSLASHAEMGKLAEKVKRLITDMAQSLSTGGIGAVPVSSNEYDPCAWCDFRAVCGYEPGDAVREIASMDKAALFKLLEEETHV